MSGLHEFLLTDEQVLWLAGHTEFEDAAAAVDLNRMMRQRIVRAGIQPRPPVPLQMIDRLSSREEKPRGAWFKEFIDRVEYDKAVQS